MGKNEVFTIANALFAYYSIMNALFSNEAVKNEDIIGKRILLIGENTVGRVDGKTVCEKAREVLLKLGAVECVVFGLLNGFHISDSRLNTEGYFYGDFSNILEVMEKQAPFDTVILMEGLERVESFRRAAADIKKMTVNEGTIYLLLRTPSDVTGGPAAAIYWYEDIWRYEYDTAMELFKEDEPNIQTVSNGNLSWLLVTMKNISASENLLDHNLHMYSCRAGRRIKEEEYPKLGYFKDRELEKLGRREVTDKCYYGHNYLDKYEHFLKGFRNREFTLLELGVFDGASERMWRDYFPKAQVIGVDIDSRCKEYEGERIGIDIADLGKIEELKRLREYRPTIIIDDASHLWSHQINALLVLFDVLPSGGIYIIEDMETSANTEQYPGFNDCELNAYTFCERIISVVMSKTPCKEEPLAEAITRIGMDIEMASVIKGSCIFVKR